MTRGTDANLAFVFTTPARPADPQPGTRPAPELGRYDRIRRERAGYPRHQPRQIPDRAGQREPIAVLADVLEPRRRRTVRLRDPAAQPGQRRPPRHPARDLDRRNQRRPPRPLPRPGHGRAAARPPPAALAPGPLAVPHPARRRTGRPGPRRGHPHRHRLPRPGRIPRHRRRPRRPDPPAHRPAAPPAARRLDRTGPPAARPRPARLPGPDRRDDGRPHPAPGPAHRPDRPRLGDPGSRPGPRRLRPPAGTGNARPPRSRPTARCTAMTIPATRSVPNPATKHRTSGPPGTRPSPPSARPAEPDVRAMPDGRLWLLRDTYAAQTAWAPRHVGKELRLSRLGAFDAALGAIRADAEADAARKTGDHDRAARHEHLAASYRALRDHYQQQEQASPRPWPTGRNGSRPLPDPAAWPSPPTPNSAAATRSRKIEPLRSAEPALSATPNASTGSSPGGKPRDGPDPRPGQSASGVPRRDGRTPAADRLAKIRGATSARPLLPTERLAGCDLAATQTADHPIGGDPPARRRARHRTRGWRLTTAHRATAVVSRQNPTVSLGIGQIVACWDPLTRKAG